MATPRPAPGIRDEVATLKRERTVEAAVELFYERGYENTTLEAVAERLGVTKPFIYAQFASKSELLAEICSRGIASSLRALDGVLALDLTPAGKLEEIARRFVAAVIESQKHIAIFSREEKNLLPADFERISDMRRSFDRKLSALLVEGQRRGEFEVADPLLASLAIGGMVSWAYVWYRPGRRLKPVELAEGMATLILSLVGARPAASRRAVRPAPSRPAAPKARARR